MLYLTLLRNLPCSFPLTMSSSLGATALVALTIPAFLKVSPAHCGRGHLPVGYFTPTVVSLWEK